LALLVTVTNEQVVSLTKQISHRWFIGCVLLILLAALPILTYPLGRDQGMYANIARWAILPGGTPYIDMWDIKPPPIYYIYAAGIALFGTSTAAIRAIDLAIVPFAMLGLYLLGTRFMSRRAGVWAAFLYGVFYFTETFASLTQSDSLVAMPMIWAVWCAVQALDHSGRKALVYAFISGAICGVVLWFKQYYAFFVVVLILNHLWMRWKVRDGGFAYLKTVFYEGLAFGIGGLLTAGGILLVCVAGGMWQEMLYVAQGTAAYNAQGYDFGAFLASMQSYLAFRWRHWGGLILLIAAGIIYAFIKRFNTLINLTPVAKSATPPLQLERGVGGEVSMASDHTQNRSETGRAIARSHSALSTQHLALNTQHSALVFLWLLSGLAFVLIQAKGFDTHWLPMLPPLCLWGAWAVEKILSLLDTMRTRRALPLQIAVSGIILLLFTTILLNSTWIRAIPYLRGEATLVQYYTHFPEGNDLKPSQSAQMVEWLQARVMPGDSIYIWGFRPEVAYMGGWRPATRFQAHFPVVAPWYPPEWKQSNVNLLWAAMPPYVLVLQDDYMPWVTNSHMDSHQLLVAYTELSNWLGANYERVEQIGDFLIWKRQQP
jgi:hypothetical protein